MIRNDRINALHCRALECGAYCAKISGAGGGGFMMFLVDPMLKRKVSTAIRWLIRQRNGAFTAHFGAMREPGQAWRVQ